MVKQLHIHIIARFTTDPAWPQPIWGKLSNITYKDTDIIDNYKNIFNSKFPI